MASAPLVRPAARPSTSASAATTVTLMRASAFPRGPTANNVPRPPSASAASVPTRSAAMGPVPAAATAATSPACWDNAARSTRATPVFRPARRMSAMAQFPTVPSPAARAVRQALSARVPTARRRGRWGFLAAARPSAAAAFAGTESAAILPATGSARRAASPPERRRTAVARCCQRPRCAGPRPVSVTSKSAASVALPAPSTASAPTAQRAGRPSSARGACATTAGCPVPLWAAAAETGTTRSATPASAHRTPPQIRLRTGAFATPKAPLAGRRRSGLGALAASPVYARRAAREPATTSPSSARTAAALR